MSFRYSNKVYTTSCNLLFFMNCIAAEIEDIFQNESEMFFQNKLLSLLSRVRRIGNQLLQTEHGLIYIGLF